jgi:hypothetical protein
VPADERGRGERRLLELREPLDPRTQQPASVIFVADMRSGS